ncbi:hypothetical protein TRFO_07685 [Tritrichomonas foetus]|uniref:Tubby C-terminal domain-containing protein n=1 Tax=Tritrichomonas foetus TaxID=1144522 RepID=A0A1J4JPF6_9EUKA|nr:hypothetical protein TRFO_07685 [Tritrichomonas foetus]|eukprot:OHT01017.1 hypothetical protein TRFO_07685 [Tritrichomonas foetus]
MTVLSQEEKEQKQFLTEPLRENHTYTSFLVRREKTKSGLPRYYIYNEDNKLLVAAECKVHNDTYYHISLESKEFDKTSPQIIGKILNRRYDSHYIGYRIEEGNNIPYLDIKYLRHYEKKTNERIMELKFPPGNDQLSNLIIVQSSDFMAEFKNKFPDYADKVSDSEKNFYLKAGDNHVFSFGKIYEDEYHFAVSHPLTILHGFYIALSTFIKLKDE